MARGRIVVNAIASDKRVNGLSDDTSRLAFTWLITFADREGRTYGDPAVVRSMLFPRREDVSIAQMREYIQEWAACGLVVWYQADGDLWISFPSFFKHQSGFDRRHEPASTVPRPPDAPTTPDICQDVSTDNVPDGCTDVASTLDVQSTLEVKRNEHEVNRIESMAAVAAVPPKSTSPPSIELTDGQRSFLTAFGAKRFKTIAQRDAVAVMETTYGIQRLTECITWAAKCGMDMGKAVLSIEKAIPNWGKPKEMHHGADKRRGPGVSTGNGTGKGTTGEPGGTGAANLHRAGEGHDDGLPAEMVGILQSIG